MSGTSRVVVTAKGLFGKICSIIGWALALLFVIVIIILIADDEFTDFDSFAVVIITAIIVLSPPVILIMIGRRIKQRIQRFRSYVSVVSAKGGSAHIEELALAVAKSPVFVLREVNSMINQRYFANANINPAAGVITINRQYDMNAYTQPPAMGMGMTGINTSSVAPQPIIIESFTCTGCAAVGSRPKGSHGECDYCGTIAS